MDSSGLLARGGHGGHGTCGERLGSSPCPDSAHNWASMLAPVLKGAWFPSLTFQASGRNSHPLGYSGGERGGWASFRGLFTPSQGSVSGPFKSCNGTIREILFPTSPRVIHSWIIT